MVCQACAQAGQKGEAAQDGPNMSLIGTCSDMDNANTTRTTNVAKADSSSRAQHLSTICSQNWCDSHEPKQQRYALKKQSRFYTQSDCVQERVCFLFLIQQDSPAAL